MIELVYQFFEIVNKFFEILDSYYGRFIYVVIAGEFGRLVVGKAWITSFINLKREKEIKIENAIGYVFNIIASIFFSYKSRLELKESWGIYAIKILFLSLAVHLIVVWLMDKNTQRKIERVRSALK